MRESPARLGGYAVEEFFLDRAALITALPSGDYTFAFNVGVPDADSVVVPHVDPPEVVSSFPADLSPAWFALQR